MATPLQISEPGSICFGLLAGGLSSRMGVDKATLPWKGEPLWKHQLRLATEIGAREILISGKADGPYHGTARIIPDAVTHCGPIGGLASLLAAMTSDWLVLVAVDMPFMDVATLRRLLELRNKDSGVVPEVDGRAEPMAGVYPSSLAGLAREHVLARDRSMQSFVRHAVAANMVSLISWDGPGNQFRSINTPAEWSALQTSRCFR